MSHLSLVQSTIKHGQRLWEEALKTLLDTHPRRDTDPLAAIYDIVLDDNDCRSILEYLRNRDEASSDLLDPLLEGQRMYEAFVEQLDADANAVELQSSEWMERLYGHMTMTDPRGWEPDSWDTPITRKVFLARAAASTLEVTRKIQAA